MDSKPSNENRKRNMKSIHAAELSWKFKSKQDLIVYLDQHRKYS